MGGHTRHCPVSGSCSHDCTGPLLAANPEHTAEMGTQLDWKFRDLLNGALLGQYVSTEDDSLRVYGR